MGAQVRDRRRWSDQLERTERRGYGRALKGTVMQGKEVSQFIDESPSSQSQALWQMAKQLFVMPRNCA